MRKTRKLNRGGLFGIKDYGILKKLGLKKSKTIPISNQGTSIELSNANTPPSSSIQSTAKQNEDNSVGPPEENKDDSISPSEQNEVDSVVGPPEENKDYSVGPPEQNEVDSVVGHLEQNEDVSNGPLEQNKDDSVDSSEDFGIGPSNIVPSDIVPTTSIIPTPQLKSEIICIIATHQSRMMCLFSKYSSDSEFSKHRFMNCAICSLSNSKLLKLEYNGNLNNIEKDYFSFEKTYWCTSDSANELNSSFDNIVFGSIYTYYLINNLDDIIKKLKKITVTLYNEKTIKDILNRLLPELSGLLNGNKISELLLQQLQDKKQQYGIKSTWKSYNDKVTESVDQLYLRTLSKMNQEDKIKLIKSIKKFIESFLEDYLEKYLNSECNLPPYNKFIKFNDKQLRDSQLNLENIKQMIFIRHGEGIHNKAKWYDKAFTMSNYLDANLTDIGLNQAKTAGTILNGILSSFEHGKVLGFASDLQRTQNTLDNINKQLTGDNEITKKYILPCSHEIGVKKGQCDDAAYYKRYANSENKSTIDLDKLTEKGWNSSYYKDFYGENRRNNRSYDLYNKSRKMMNKRRYCKDTDMIKEVISIVDSTQNNSVLSQGGKKTRKNYKKKSRKIKKKCKIKKSKTCRRNNK